MRILLLIYQKIDKFLRTFCKAWHSLIKIIIARLDPRWNISNWFFFILFTSFYLFPLLFCVGLQLLTILITLLKLRDFPKMAQPYQSSAALLLMYWNLRQAGFCCAFLIPNCVIAAEFNKGLSM